MRWSRWMPLNTSRQRLRLQVPIYGYSMRYQDKLEHISPVCRRETHLAMEWLGCQHTAPVGLLDKYNLVKGAGANCNSNTAAGWWSVTALCSSRGNSTTCQNGWRNIEFWQTNSALTFCLLLTLEGVRWIRINLTYILFENIRRGEGRCSVKGDNKWLSRYRNSYFTSYLIKVTTSMEQSAAS